MQQVWWWQDNFISGMRREKRFIRGRAIWIHELSQILRRFWTKVHGSTPSDVSETGFRRYGCDSGVFAKHLFTRPKFGTDQFQWGACCWQCCKTLDRLHQNEQFQNTDHARQGCKKSYFFVVQPRKRSTLLCQICKESCEETIQTRPESEI